MFNNIGEKIKGLAKVVCYLGIIGSIITGLVLIAIGSGSTVILGIFIAVVGSIMSWVGSCLTYGFGQLVENSDILVKQSNIPVNNIPVNNIPVNNIPVSSKPQENLSTDQYERKERVDFIYVGETNIKCANCGCVQFKGNKKCIRCSSTFSNLK